jgi:hypothetical protein
VGPIRSRGATIGATLASVLVVACNMLTGADKLEVSADAIGADAGPNHVSDAKAILDAGPPPTCPSAGHSCVKAPPAGWDGPFLEYVGVQQGAPPCPSEMPEIDDGMVGVLTGDFTCECKCGAVTGAKCTAFLDEFNGGGCVDPAVGREDLSGCRTPGGNNSFKASLDVTDKGSCAATGAFKTKAAATFDSIARLCRRPTPFVSSGCGGDELCVPDSAAPFKVQSCIASNDVNAECPAPWTNPHRVYGDVADTRACNPGTCACDEPDGITCTARMKKYNFSTTCQGQGTSLDLPVTTCVAAGAGTSQKLTDGPAASGGACNAHGEPEPAGGVAGAGGRTVCCLP